MMFHLLDRLTSFQKRAFSSLVMILGTGIIFLGGEIPLKMLFFILAIALTFEWVKICKLPSKQTISLMLAVMLGAMYTVLIGRTMLGFGLLFFSMSVSIFLSWFSWYSRFLWVALGLLYIGLPCFAGLWLLTSVSSGVWALLWVIIVVSVNDMAAYIIGSWLKGPKLIESISPGKTWSGFIGGLVAATLAGGLFYFSINVPMSVQWFMKLSCVIAFWGCVGDLFESKIKRVHHIKDSGGLIPGHGGLFDRLDGILFAIPLIALLFWIWPQIFSFEAMVN